TLKWQMCLQYLEAKDHAKCVNVKQNPSFITTEVGDTVTLHCEHDGGASYPNMYWYQQQDGLTALKLNGYLAFTNAVYEYNPDGRFKLTGDGSKQGRLTISDLTTEDSAMYYCAASYHIAAKYVNRMPKTLRKNKYIINK
uniref:Ig-like domain-containing protein n=1 Tax=Erpetoichthys calabaricus TaxID=27687 RepID=A0A8C4TGG7_ERPCA